MTRDELQPDGFGVYKAYYQGRLVQITDPNIPTILDLGAIQCTVAWSDLTARPQPKIIIHSFTATPDSVIEDSDILVSWSVENASEIRITRGGSTLHYVTGTGSLNVKAAGFYYYQKYNKYDLDIGLIAIGDGGRESANVKVIVFPKPKPEPTVERTPAYSTPHVCPDHPTIADATYHATQIENEIELFLSELRQQSKEDTRK